MKNNIAFDTFQITPERIDFQYKITDPSGELLESKPLYFEFSKPVLPSENTIAIALSNLCMYNYSNVYFDLNLDPAVITQMEQYTRSKITAKDTSSVYAARSNSSRVCLSFSGGMDSLACYYLVPPECDMVSLRFSDNEDHEYNFFKDFDTLIVKTNFTETTLHRCSWTYMGIGCILCSEYFNSKYISFGTVLETHPNNISSRSLAEKNQTFAAFKLAGLSNAPYSINLTEVGTIMVVAHFAPELIASSLKSLAVYKSDKYYRKGILSHIINSRLHLNLSLEPMPKPERALSTFGHHFLLDFLTFYMIKYCDHELVEAYIRNIPAEVYTIADKLSLSFYERYHTNFLLNFPSELRPDFVKRLDLAGILPYTEKDFDEFHEIKQYLLQYHSALK